MEKMRNFMQSWAGKAILIGTLIPMAFLGVQSFSGGGHIASNEIVKVGDSAIDLHTFQSEINGYRSRLLEQVDASLIDDKALSDEVLQSLIDRALLENQAQFFGMSVSDATITRLLQADSNFHDGSGKFSNDVFARYLQSRGMTKDMLFSLFRTQLSLRQLSGAVLGTALYPDNQVSRLLDLQTQSRELWVLRYHWQDFADKVNISPAQIEAYYHANKDKMTQSPSVDLAYVVLTNADIKVEAPTDDEIKAEYETALQSRGVSHGQELAHILITGDDAKARADEIKAKLDNGENFETLAKEYSDDPTGETGGNIGTYNPAFFGDSSQTVKNAIEELGVGQISQPVQTKFGYHIFKITKMNDVPSLDSMRDELIKQATERKQTNAMSEMIAKINGMATDGMGISDIAQATGLTAKTIKDYTKENNTSELSAPVVISAAFDEFAVSEQSVSPSIALPNKTVWVQPTNYQDSKTRSLAQASDTIKAILIKESAIKLAAQAAQEKAKESADVVAKSAKSLGVVTRQSAGLLPAERASLFLHDVDGMSVWAVETAEGASVLVGKPISSVATSQLPEEQRLVAAKIMRDNVGQDQLQDYLHYLRATKEVQINEQAMSGH